MAKHGATAKWYNVFLPTTISHANAFATVRRTRAGARWGRVREEAGRGGVWPNTVQMLTCSQPVLFSGARRYSGYRNILGKCFVPWLMTSILIVQAKEVQGE